MHLKPLQDWAVIRKSEAQERTASGIFIPEIAKEKPLEGFIVAIGPGKFVLEKGKEKEKKKKFIPTVLKPGQRIIYQKYAEREIELAGETLVLVREEDILGTIEEHNVVEKKTHPVEAKKEGRVAIRTEAKVPAVTAPPAAGEKATKLKKKPSAIKPAAKKAVQKKKPAAKKEKASAKKRSAKKPPSVKAKRPAAKKTASKAPSKKKRAVPKKAVAKKAAPKKIAAKKPSQKKTATKGTTTKKAALKKATRSGAKQSALKSVKKLSKAKRRKE